ncbi:MAG: LacI family transcriptional regulator [Chloroflexi bacterium]|nr:LacI family transcriptional regulator [Chloroflexota bacterium]
MEVTIADIARRAGVSKATVSRVLNNKPDVDAAKRERILGIIRETGYVPRLAAVSLATGRTNLIGLLAPSLSRPWSLEVIQGISEAIESTAYELVLYTTSLDERNQELFARALSNGLTDGLLIMLPRNSTGYLSQLEHQGFPTVLIDHRGVPSSLPTVTAANIDGAYAAIHHLLTLGHRRIGIITGIMDFGCSRDRLEGYKKALRDAGIAPDPHLIKYGDFSESTGYALAEQWLRDSTSQRPTAIFASNDAMAFGVLRAARAAGISVPDDLAVVGFDDVPGAAQTHPALTTVRQPLRDMGRRAVEMLLLQIRQGRPAESKVVVPTELIVRESCGAKR